jgi:hypothetical protein
VCRREADGDVLPLVAQSGDDACVIAWPRVDIWTISQSTQDGQLQEFAMDKDMASRVLKTVAAVEARIGELDLLVSQLNDKKERDDYVTALGNVIGIISENFVRRIVRQYPELDPDRQDEENTPT